MIDTTPSKYCGFCNKARSECICCLPQPSPSSKEMLHPPGIAIPNQPQQDISIEIELGKKPDVIHKWEEEGQPDKKEWENNLEIEFFVWLDKNRSRSFNDILEFFKKYITSSHQELREHLAKEVEHQAHFSKLAGSKYDGYIYYKDVLKIISHEDKK